MREQRPEVDGILRYFDAKTKGKRLAERSDVSPVELKDKLPNICVMVPIYDASGALSDVIIKLIGTTLVDFYGEMTGKSIFKHPAPEVAERIFISVERCIKERAPVAAEAFSLSKAKSYLQVTALYVPLSSDGKTIDQLFLYTTVKRNSVEDLT